MHSVLFKLEQQAELHKEMQKMRQEWLSRQYEVSKKRPKEIAVLKKVGLWNMRDEDFYASDEIFEQTLRVTNMCLRYALFGAKYYRKLNQHDLEIFNCVDEIPIVCINPNEYAFELIAPFTPEFFEKLMNNECNILEFGSEYTFICNAKVYGTIKLFELFYNQNFNNHGSN